ncbi:MAG: flagellar basal body L-ring protein FlgH [Phycisphaerae bacterium]|nr:flagellar basal body L-ring protein FlgH [Phycisphaerae bacterium]
MPCDVRILTAVAATLFGAASVASAQTSSLMYRSRTVASTQPYRGEDTQPLTQGYQGMQRRAVSPATKTLQRVSLMAVVPEPPRQFREHDLITIIVRQHKKYEGDATTDNKKDANFNAILDAWFRIHDGKWVQQQFGGNIPEIKGKFGGQLKADGKSEREDKFTARITAEVVDVKPNGNLVLEASSRVKNDEEEQILTLCGVCRGLDVAPDNTVLSTQLADLQIMEKNTGAVRDATRRGWIPKTLDFLRPF